MRTPSLFTKRDAKIIASGWPTVLVAENAKGGPIRFDVNPDAPQGDLLGVLMPLVARQLRARRTAKKS